MRHHFDVNSIIGIKFVGERKTTISWYDERKHKRFFGLFKDWVQPAGFYDNSEWEAVPYTKAELVDWGYKVYDTDERINDRVVHKSRVIVYLGHDLEVSKEFETVDEANEWIDLLVSTSGKTFEVVKYK